MTRFANSCARRASLSTIAAMVLALTALATNAGAGTLTVDMDFTGSTLEFIGGIITVPPDGTITSGSGSFTVPANSATDPLAGASTVQGINLAATLNATVISQATVTGNVAGSQVGVGAGTLSAGLGNIIFGGASLALTGLVNCVSTGPQCGLLGLPINLSGTFPLSGTLPVGNLASSGNATLAGTFAFTVSGISATLHLVGVEVSRTFLVPEPASGLLVGGGLVVLAGLARSWRRQRGSVAN